MSQRPQTIGALDQSDGENISSTASPEQHTDYQWCLGPGSAWALPEPSPSVGARVLLLIGAER